MDSPLKFMPKDKYESLRQRMRRPASPRPAAARWAQELWQQMMRPAPPSQADWDYTPSYTQPPMEQPQVYTQSPQAGYSAPYDPIANMTPFVPSQEQRDETRQMLNRVADSMFSRIADHFGQPRSAPEDTSILDQMEQMRERARENRANLAARVPQPARDLVSGLGERFTDHLRQPAGPTAPISEFPETAQDIAARQGRADDTRELLDTAWRSFGAGIGDVAHTAGSAAQWLGREASQQGMPEIAERLGATGEEWRSEGDQVREARELEMVGLKGLESLEDPRFYATTVARGAPFTLGLLALAIPLGLAGSTVAGLAGLGVTGKAIAGSLTAGVGSRIVEGALEAGGTYDEALKRGMGEQEAMGAARKVFLLNQSLALPDAAQFALSFAKIPAPIKRGLGKMMENRFGRAGVGAARLLGVTGMEAGEEVAQEVFQRHALGDEIAFDLPMQEAAVVGGIMGATMGGAGRVTSALRGGKELLGEEAEGPQRSFLERLTPGLSVEEVGDGPGLAEAAKMQPKPKDYERMLRGTLDGKAAWADGRVVVVDDKPPRQFDSEINYELDKRLPDPGGSGAELHPVSVISLPDVPDAVVFRRPGKAIDDIHVIDSRYYGLFRRRFGDVRFVGIREQSPIHVYRGNERVGVVMPIVLSGDVRQAAIKALESRVQPSQVANAQDSDQAWWGYAVPSAMLHLRLQGMREIISSPSASQNNKNTAADEAQRLLRELERRGYSKGEIAANEVAAREGEPIQPPKQQAPEATEAPTERYVVLKRGKVYTLKDTQTGQIISQGRGKMDEWVKALNEGERKVGESAPSTRVIETGRQSAEPAGESGPVIDQDTSEKRDKYPKLAAQTEKPASGEARLVSAAKEGVTITEKSGQGGVEVKFRTKPDRSILDGLKKLGFKWSMTNQLWHARPRDESHRGTLVAQVRRLTGMNVEKTAESETSRPQAEPYVAPTKQETPPTTAPQPVQQPSQEGGIISSEEEREGERVQLRHEPERRDARGRDQEPLEEPLPQAVQGPGSERGTGRVGEGNRETDENRGRGVPARGVRPVSGLEHSEAEHSPANLVVAAEAEARREPGHTVPSENPTARGRDFVITDADAVGKGGMKTRAQRNIEALRIVKKLREEKRKATPEEQAKLVQYVGWGASDLANNLFHPDKPRRGYYDSAGRYSYRIDEQWAKEWESIYDDLREVLTDEEFAKARSSSKNAHYTSPNVVRGIWDAIVRLGGGRLPHVNVLEPAAGIGHFFGLMPAEIAAKSTRTAVEIDLATGEILQQLYQNANVHVVGYEKAPILEGSADIVVSNVPFGGYSMVVPRWLRDRKKRWLNSLSIHNQYFAKALEDVRAGGLVVFITSHFTLDASTMQNFREQLGRQADFLGAIRLPRTAFKENASTEVVTDIIFLRKLLPNEKPSDTKWYGVQKAVTGEKYWDSATRKYVTPAAEVNEYFIEHPEMVLGTHSLEGSMYSGREYTVEPKKGNLDEQLQKAISNLPKDVIKPYEKVGADGIATPAHLPPAVDTSAKPGAYFIHDDGNLYIRGKDGAEQLANKGDAAEKRIRAMMEIGDTGRLVNRLQLENASTQEYEDALRRLNTLYEAFVLEFGPINGKYNRQLMGEDPDFFFLRSLEDWRAEVIETIMEPYKTSKGAQAVRLKLTGYTREIARRLKVALFHGPNVRPPTPVTRVDNPKDGLAASLNDLGRVDLNHIARISRRTVEEAREDLRGLIYELPEGGYEEASAYLSGDVRAKLHEARNAAENDDRFDENVTALEQVQPKDLEPALIRVNLGANWVSASVYERFLGDLTGVNARLVYFSADGSWRFADKPAFDWRNLKQRTDEWGIPEYPAEKIFLDAMNGKTPEVTERISGKIVRDEVASAAARVKMMEMKARFREWVWADPKRSQPLAKLYNEVYNNIVVRRFDGSHLTLPGSSSAIKLKKHQLNAIWRVLTSGNTLFAHEVGSGKTFAMVGSIMESRRLGLAKKAVMVVPNHLVEQTAYEFMRLYPNATILVPRPKDFQKDNRNEMMSRIATGEWDAVIVSQSQFTKLPMSEEAKDRFYREELDAYWEMYYDLKANDASAATIKEIEKKIAKKKERLEKRRLRIEARQDVTITWEELGVDMLVVDEADAYKNLEFITQRKRIRNLPNSHSQRAEDMYLKVRHVNQRTGGRGIVFATGTPIANTIAELWTMMRYLAPDKLARDGVNTFDAWANSWAETVTDLEATITGEFREIERFAKFANVPELSRKFQEVADIVMEEDLDISKPPLIGGEPVVVECGESPDMPRLQEWLQERYRTVTQRYDPHSSDNVLVIYSDGRKAALDIRLVWPKAQPAKNSKVEKCCENIIDIYHKHADQKAAQVVFLDLSTPKGDTLERKYKAAEEADDKTPTVEDEDAIGTTPDDSDVDVETVTREEQVVVDNIYKQIKDRLIKLGIPAGEIAFIHDAKNHEAKKQLFDQVNVGKVRVILGSTEKLGAGTNIQLRLKALHHLDVPWRPRDVEQREGRILRQGSLFGPPGSSLPNADNSGVHIFRYVTAASSGASADAVVWQQIIAKWRGIKSIMHREVSFREIEDNDFDVQQAYSALAIAAGNPLALERAKALAALSEIELLRSSHLSRVRQAEWDTANLPERIVRYKESIERLKADALWAKEQGGKPWSFVIDGKRYTDQDEATKALQGWWATNQPKMHDRLIKKKRSETIVERVGEINGWRLDMEYDETTVSEIVQTKDEKGVTDAKMQLTPKILFRFLFSHSGEIYPESLDYRGMDADGKPNKSWFRNYLTFQTNHINSRLLHGTADLRRAEEELRLANQKATEPFLRETKYKEFLLHLRKMEWGLEKGIKSLAEVEAAWEAEHPSEPASETWEYPSAAEFFVFPKALPSPQDRSGEAHAFVLERLRAGDTVVPSELVARWGLPWPEAVDMIQAVTRLMADEVSRKAGEMSRDTPEGRDFERLTDEEIKRPRADLRESSQAPEESRRDAEEAPVAEEPVAVAEEPSWGAEQQRLIDKMKENHAKGIISGYRLLSSGDKAMLEKTTNSGKVMRTVVFSDGNTHEHTGGIEGWEVVEESGPAVAPPKEETKPQKGKEATPQAKAPPPPYEQLLEEAIDWQYLTIKGGGMARKSDLDKWLMSRYEMSPSDARDISNAVESVESRFLIGDGRVQWVAERPEPTLEQYPGLIVKATPRPKAATPESEPAAPETTTPAEMPAEPEKESAGPKQPRSRRGRATPPPKEPPPPTVQQPEPEEAPKPAVDWDAELTDQQKDTVNKEQAALDAKRTAGYRVWKDKRNTIFLERIASRKGEETSTFYRLSKVGTVSGITRTKAHPEWVLLREARRDIKAPKRPEIPSPPQLVDDLARLEEALREEKPPIRDSLNQTLQGLLRALYDRNYPLKEIERRTGISTHKLAQIVPGTEARGESNVVRYVLPVLKRVGNDVDVLEKYMVAMRMLDLRALNPEALLPGEVQDPQSAIDQLKARVGQERWRRVESAATELWKLNDQLVLKPYLDAGIISQEAYDAIKERWPHYIPFYRQGYDWESVLSTKSSRAVANVSEHVIKVLSEEGSVKKLKHPLANWQAQVVKTQTVIGRNNAALALRDALEQYGKAIGEKLVVENKVERTTEKDTIRLYEDGKRKVYTVPAVYAAVAKGLEAEPGNTLAVWIRRLAAPLRGGAVTYNPAFVVVNPMRDAISAWYREGLVPMSPTYIKGMVAAVTQNDAWFEAAQAGVFMSGITEMGRTTDKLRAISRLGGIPLNHPADVLLYLPRLIRRANEASEQGTRIATYHMLRGKGVSELEAAVRARDATVDFAKAGNLVKYINTAIPFFNAGVHGSANAMRTMRDNPKAALLHAAPLLLLTILADLWNRRWDDDDEKLSEMIPDYERINNWVFIFGEGKRLPDPKRPGVEPERFPIYFKLPKGPLGAFLTAPAEMVVKLNRERQDGTTAEIVMEAARDMAMALLPMEPALSGITPPVLSTGLALQAGYDYFRGQPIVPQREQARVPQQQYGPETYRPAILTAEKIGEISQSLGQRWHISPRSIEFAITDFTGGAGRTSLWLADMALQAIGYDPMLPGEATTRELTEAEKASRHPVIGRFVGTKNTAEAQRGWKAFNNAVSDTRQEFAQIPEVRRLGINLGEVSGTVKIDGKDLHLKPEQRAEYQRKAGELATLGVEKLTASDYYNQVDDERKRKLFTSVTSFARATARGLAIAEATGKKVGVAESAMPALVQDYVKALGLREEYVRLPRYNGLTYEQAQRADAVKSQVNDKMKDGDLKEYAARTAVFRELRSAGMIADWRLYMRAQETSKERQAFWQRHKATLGRFWTNPPTEYLPPLRQGALAEAG